MYEVKNNAVEMLNAYNQTFRDKTKELSILIITCLSKLPYSDDLSIIRKQIFKSVTSVAANYRAVNRARSDKEKFFQIMYCS